MTVILFSGFRFSGDNPAENTYFPTDQETCVVAIPMESNSRSQRTLARSISSLNLEPPNPRLLDRLRGTYTAEGQDPAVTAVGHGQMAQQRVLQGDVTAHRNREGQ